MRVGSVALNEKWLILTGKDLNAMPNNDEHGTVWAMAPRKKNAGDRPSWRVCSG
jgi:hypothetical protein